MDNHRTRAMWIWGSMMLLVASAAIGEPAAKSKKRSTSRPTASKPATTQGTTTSAAAQGIAHIRLVGEILESPPDFTLFDDSSYMVLRDWLQRLGKARTDNSISAVALEIGCSGLTWAQAQELAQAVERLKAEKPVYAFVSTPSASEYLVASAASEVSMENTGQVMMVGLGAELTFFRGTLDMLGIKPQMIQIGRFKGAAEPISQTQPSSEVTSMYNWLLDDLYAQLCQQVARQRHLTVDQVKQAINAGPFSGADAVKFKLVDHLVPHLDWPDHVVAEMARKGAPAPWRAGYGRKPRTPLDLSNPFSLLAMLAKGGQAEQSREPTIAIVCADGMIISGRSGEALFGQKLVGDRTLVEAFESVRKDSKIKAVVFRINSPGGSAQASEEIYQAVCKCAAAKPVIVSIGAIGGSGGYYIAAGAKTIIADPSAIVGSIGVVTGKLALTGLMDKIGVTTYEITRGDNAGLNLSRAWTQREQAVMTRLAQETYDTFVDHVKQGRGAKIKDIAAVAEGRVFTGRQAVENGLVDSVGGLKEAMAAAQQAAGLKDNYYMITLPKPRNLLELLSGSDTDTLAPAVLANLSKSPQGALLGAARAAGTSLSAQYLLNLAVLMDRETILAAMPYYLQIKY